MSGAIGWPETALVVAVFLPLLAAGGAVLWRPGGFLVTLVTALGLIAALSVMTPAVHLHGGVEHALGDWGAPLGILLYLDGFSLLLLWLNAIVGALVSLYARAYFAAKPEQAELFWPLWLLLWCGLNGAYVSGDLFNLFVTMELIGLSAVALVALTGGGVALRAAMRYLLFAVLASMFYLLGVVLVYGATGTLDLRLIGALAPSSPALTIAAVLMTVGLMLKTAVFPLHVWLPPAHANAPAPVSALLSALVVKASLYLILRLWLWVFPELFNAGLGLVIGLAGAGAILYGSLQAMRQNRLKLVVAYSTVAQLGYMVLVFPLMQTLAWQASVYQILIHGLAKAAMFLAAGNIMLARGSDDLRQLVGLDRVLALNLFAFALAGVSIIGLPPSGGFLAKWMLLLAALEQGAWGFLVVIVIGSLLAAGYIFRVLTFALSEPPGVRLPDAVSLPASLLMVPLVLALLAILAGFVSAPILALLAVSPPPLLGASP